MTSDYVDNWDALPTSVQNALFPIIALFDEAADLLFDRRLNLSFEAAVKDLSIPGIVALTNGLRALRDLLQTRVTVDNTDERKLHIDGVLPLTAYDLPLYTPSLYLSQLAQYMNDQNVRVWKEATAAELIGALIVMARYVRPDMETARVMIAALHDMMFLYPGTVSIAEEAGETEKHFPNAVHIALQAARLARKR